MRAIRAMSIEYVCYGIPYITKTASTFKACHSQNVGILGEGPGWVQTQQLVPFLGLFTNTLCRRASAHMLSPNASLYSHLWIASDRWLAFRTSKIGRKMCFLC